MDYKYNELEYAKTIYEKGFQTKYIPTELKILALYFRDEFKMKPKERSEKLFMFCEANIPYYNKAKHYQMINKAIQQSSNKSNMLITINNIKIYDDEINYINSIKLSDNHKKVLFTLLVQKKLSKNVYDIKNTYTHNEKEYNMLYFNGGPTTYNKIKKMANIPTSVKLNDEIIYDLSNYSINDTSNQECINNIEHLISIYHNGLIYLNYLTKIKEIGDVKIIIENFNNVGWYLDYYNSINNIKLCKYCNQPFKQSKKNLLYCSEHKQYYRPLETKIITCIDCGEEVIINSMDNKTCRCKKHTDLYNKERNRIRQKEWYDKHIKLSNGCN